ncbi:MAG: hypothetical protein KA023_09395 [Bacteroidales bacterium]|uniref:hypothetical protein n=1 Tax=Bacteroides sp. TaxID=29523 RepID=UPI001B6B5F2C|nr:hypothetical protein [Bacteroides sp.]MBP7874987.1 hypothetical protein [Bacteroidales bacterium]MBP9586355.1 hypothetical protein [Bacteroides sp.]
MEKEKTNEKPNLEVRDPSAAYHSKCDLLKREIPDYVWEDVRIGMEQFERGECRPIELFLKKQIKINI